MGRLWWQAMQQKRDPDMMVIETCAITTRVAPSFVRIGHLDLFARRATKVGSSSYCAPRHPNRLEPWSGGVRIKRWYRGLIIGTNR